MTRIAIIGAGAIGSSLGGLLRRAGHDVTLVGRSAHVNAIRDRGLHVDGVLGSFTVNVAAAESLGFRPDFAFLTVKTQDVAAAAQANAAVLHDVSIVTFQNGVRSDELVRDALPSLPDMPVLLARLMRLLPIPLAGRVAAAKIQRMESRWPLLGSTLQSLQRRRPTEIDYLNGEVVRLGEQMGHPTPVNRTIVELVRRVERTGRFLSVGERLHHLIQQCAQDGDAEGYRSSPL
jgi:ketopantoate reductase